MRNTSKVHLAKRLLLWETESTNRVQTLYKAVCVSLHAKVFGNDMNPLVFIFDEATSLWEGKPVVLCLRIDFVWCPVCAGGRGIKANVASIFLSKIVCIKIFIWQIYFLINTQKSFSFLFFSSYLSKRKKTVIYSNIKLKTWLKYSKDF